MAHNQHTSALAHTDHLEQGEGGAGKTRNNGSHLDPSGSAEGAVRKGPSIAAKGGAIPANVPGPKNVSGSHLTPHPAETDKTADRQGGTVRGHDRVNPNAGKAHSDKHVATRVV